MSQVPTSDVVDSTPHGLGTTEGEAPVGAGRGAAALGAEGGKRGQWHRHYTCAPATLPPPPPALDEATQKTYTGCAPRALTPLPPLNVRHTGSGVGGTPRGRGSTRRQRDHGPGRTCHKWLCPVALGQAMYRNRSPHGNKEQVNCFLRPFGDGVLKEGHCSGAPVRTVWLPAACAPEPRPGKGATWNTCRPAGERVRALGGSHLGVRGLVVSIGVGADLGGGVRYCSLTFEFF